MPPKRKHAKRDLPANLYEEDGAYRYRNPLSGDWLWLGRIPKRDAIAQALEANLYLADQLAAPRLIDRLNKQAGDTVAAWIDRFELDELAKRELAAKTLRVTKYYGKIVKASAIGALVIDRVEIRDIADFLKTYTDRGKHRMALAFWSYLKDLFASAIGAGWIRSAVNPVLNTSKPVARVMRARLTLDAFNTIFAAAGKLEPWVQNSMLLAIVSTQRLEDIGAAEFKEREKTRVWSADGRLWVEQEKTGAKLCIPLALRLEAIGVSLGQVVTRCRDDVVSPWLIHHTRNRTKAKAGDPVHENTISKGFARARAASGLTWPALNDAGRPQTPPTFHELRSLGARLYEAQGGVNVQALLGHRDPKTTAVYKDSRGAEWQEVRIA